MKTIPGDLLRATERYLELSKHSDQRELRLELLELLHCPYLEKGAVAFYPVGKSSDLRSEIQVCLRRLLLAFLDDTRHRQGNRQILFGVAYYDCITNYKNDETAAYAMATSMLFYIEDYLPTDVLDRFVESRICALISEWLKPSVDWLWLSRPGLSTVCQRFFGEAWCMLALPHDIDTTDQDGIYRTRGESVAQLVARHRPPFEVGLCKAQGQINSIALPEDIGVST